MDYAPPQVVDSLRRHHCQHAWLPRWQQCSSTGQSTSCRCSFVCDATTQRGRDHQHVHTTVVTVHLLRHSMHLNELWMLEGAIIAAIAAAIEPQAQQRRGRTGKLARDGAIVRPRRIIMPKCVTRSVVGKAAPAWRNRSSRSVLAVA